MKELISNHSAPLGTTSGGRDWCLKALHPSDPLVEVRGIPDESAVPSVFMNYQTVQTISPAAGATGTWALDGQLIPNPLSFAAHKIVDSVGTRYVETLNSQVTGADHGARLNQFLSSFQRWRLAYASVTIYQDGPDLANQGTVCVCQKPVEPILVSPQNQNAGGPATTMFGYYNTFYLEASDLPDYTKSQGMPNAYFGRSKEGAYIPLKLTQAHHKWHGTHDLISQCNGGSMVAWTDSNKGGILQIPTSVNEFTGGVYPFLSMNEWHQNSATWTPTGTVTSAFCNDVWADFSFRNMAVTTSLSFFYRFGFEMQVQPYSTLAPHLKLSPPYDPAAIACYHAIARELKDAYPADFNDLGKIWDVISGIAKTVAPALSVIPEIGPILSMAVPAVTAIGDRIRQATSRVKQPTIGSTSSTADVEAVRAALPQPSSLPVDLRRAIVRRAPRDRTASIQALEQRISQLQAQLRAKPKRFNSVRPNRS